MLWLLKVSWVSALITRSKARALAAQGPAESREGLPDSPSAVEWPSLPALPTPPQQPNNSRFQSVLRSFRKVIHPLRRGSHDSASRREHPSFESVESLPPPPLEQLAETNVRVSENATPRQPNFSQINDLPSAQSPRPPLPVRHIPPGFLDPLEDSELSELPSSSDSEESSLPSLRVSLTSEPVSNNSARRNISVPDRVLNQSSESEFVVTDHVPMSRQERADDSVAQICDAIRSMAVQENPRSKLVVSFPVFRGDESEDVFDFLDNFKRAATLNGWSNEDLAVGLPLYLKGHASAWFKSLGNVDGKTFDQLKALMTEHFASGASAWRIRQTLGQRRQLEKEPVSEYSYSVRMHCARLNLPISEWTHYFVQGLKPEIREYVILQQPENYEVAENYAKLKESVLASSDKPQAFDPKQMSSQIVAELSRVISPGNETIGAMGSQQTNFHDAHFKRMARDEFHGLTQNSGPSGNEFRRRRNFGAQTSFRPRAINRVCYNCGRKGHLHYDCNEKPDPRVPRQNNSRRGSNFYGQQNRFSGNNFGNNQGN